MRWQDRWPEKLKTPEQAARLVKSGDTVVLPSGPPQPTHTCHALSQRKDELEDVTIVSSNAGPYAWLEPGCERSFNVVSLFTSAFGRHMDRQRRSDWVPNIFGLSDGLRHSEPMRATHYAAPDVCVIPIPPPDADGRCSFGTGLWYTPTAARAARTVIGEVDPTMAWTFDQENLHVSDLACLVDTGPRQPAGPRPLPLPAEEDTGPLAVIGAYVADLIRDGDTLEVGIGSASEAVVEFLGTKNDLCFDTEVIPAFGIDLVRAGVFSGRRNNVHPGKNLTTVFYIYEGMPRRDELMSFVDRNPAYEMHDVSYLCNVPRVASIDKLVAINTALTIDLTGQVVCSHLGGLPIAGLGGQPEYMIGAHYSKGGRAITTLLSTAKQGTVSRIVPQHEPGDLIGLPCYYVDYLVTEHGVVNLDCKSLRQRAEAIISVAHPDFQPELRKAARERFWP